MAFDRLITKIAQTQNPTVAGLDPKLAYIPSYIKEKCFAEYGVTLKARRRPSWSSTRASLTPCAILSRR